MYPLCDPVLHISAISDERDVTGAGERLKPANRREQFHPVVGGMCFPAGKLFLMLPHADKRTPAAGARVALARAVGCNFDLL